MPTPTYYEMPSERPADWPANVVASNVYDSRGWPKVVCEDCGGRGWYWAPINAYEAVREHCERCGGHGWVYRIEKKPTS